MRWHIAIVLVIATGAIACGSARTAAPGSAAPQARAAASQSAVPVAQAAQGGYQSQSLPNVQLTIFSPPVQTNIKSPIYVGPNQGGITCDEVVELASDRLLYTSDELKQMGDYLSKRIDLSPPAGLLQLTTVSAIDPRSHRAVNRCHLQLQITNTGGSTAQIDKAGLRITTAPRTNTQQYRLVDACSITGVPACQGQIGAGASGCDLYYTNVTLGPASSGDVIADTPTAQDANDNPCPPIALSSLPQLLSVTRW